MARNEVSANSFLQWTMKKTSTSSFLEPTWDWWGLAGSCRPLLRSCWPPDRCEWGSPSLWWLREFSGSCSENTAAPSAPFARWRCDRGCWRGYSRTSPGAPASSGLWRFGCEGSWCTHCVPCWGPLSWGGPAGKHISYTLICVFMTTLHPLIRY